MFKIVSELKGAKARAGEIKTTHGIIKTPAFVPVATQATLKSVLIESINEYIKPEALLSNAYHLYLQPGHSIIKNAGGLNKFMNYSGPTFTDSGGFQVLSLGSGYKKVLAMETEKLKAQDIVAKKGDRLAHVDDEGVTFKSHIDGSNHRFTPEKSMEIQFAIGADIIFAFDECTTLVDNKKYQEKALDRTYKWAKRCIKRHDELDKNKTQLLFGVIQGANYKDLRQKACNDLATLNFDGYGIGGALNKNKLSEIISWCTEILPIEKPKHLLGIGEVTDIFQTVEQGIDTYDCVAPSRMARHGTLITHKGLKHLSHGGDVLSKKYEPIDKKCTCYVCKNYSISYINHLYKAKEMLASTLSTIHNEFFIVNLVKSIRKSIIDGNYFEFKNDFLKEYR